MNARAALANLTWLASNVPAHRRFGRALHDPAAAQAHWLRAHLGRNGHTAYGRAHGCNGLGNYTEFARRVPIATYADLEPWINRTRRGEAGVLVQEPVIRLVPTSGSTAARKLIPFTAALQREFNAAVGPWMVNLAATFPSVATGPAYWSVTPVGTQSCAEDEDSAVPIGFDQDSAYLGGARAWLVEAAMAVPSSASRTDDARRFRQTTLLHLLACSDLRLISVWHPSFLALLLSTLAQDWDSLLSELSSKLPGRVRELRRANPAETTTIWPRLRVVSCWADAHARAPAADLGRRLPGIHIQPKGLLATEGCVTLPYAGEHPVALCSHLFEFLDDRGAVHPVEDLRRGMAYEVIVTTGGGLWRYRLGDRVEVTGYAERTPCLRFLGRAGNVSDRCGEKLSEAFVTQVLANVCAEAPFAMLAPDLSEETCHYILFIQSANTPEPDSLAAQLDAALAANPHYALCRRLGQLGAPRVEYLGANAYERFVAAETARGLRLGDIKPVALSQRADWRVQLGCASGALAQSG